MLLHWLTDFALQTDEQARGKATSMKMLLRHVFIYSAIWLFGAAIIFDSADDVMLFTAITFVCHFLTDYNTAPIVRELFEKRDYHNAFVVVGFDQFLHLCQLFITTKLLL